MSKILGSRGLTGCLAGSRQVHLSAPVQARQTRVHNLDPAKIIENEKQGIFRTLDIGIPKPFRKWEERGPRRSVQAAPARETVMKPDQDWASVWPGTRTFHPATVPLPVRQGFAQLKSQITPGKYANVELMKVPNFLHLTPPAIKKHCNAIKKFCTEWPKELEDEEILEAHYPLKEITSDYLNSSSSIRDFRARVTTIQLKVSSLFLDAHARQKLIRLVGLDRYDIETDTISITADRCPYRAQNRDYCDYLLKALYYESRNKEAWEEKDMTEYDKVEYEARGEDQVTPQVRVLLNEGENVRTLADYKAAALSHFKLKDKIPISAS